MTAKDKNYTPRLRHHKATGQGFVELNGRRIYLGKFNLPETRRKYHQQIAEWMANGRQLEVRVDELTIVELAARFWQHAQSYYRMPDGAPTSTLHNYKAALCPLKRLYGETRAADFGPKAIKCVRHQMVEAGWCRLVVNQAVNLICGVFRWGVAEELVPVETLTALRAVAPLRRGRSNAPDREPVKPAPAAHIEAIQPHVPRQIWVLVRLQLLTGARPGELVLLRPIDFDMSNGQVWTASIEHHKKAHLGRQRVLYLGPRAQQVVRPFMSNRPVDAYLFSPGEAIAERSAAASTHRRPGQPETLRQTSRRVGDHYTTASYRRSIERACRAAGVPVWSPHRLRHNAATLIRKEFGLEAAQLMLGHAWADTTQIYAEVNQAKALEVAAKIG